ncbi:DUF4931 domain-containing protein [Candidatus Uhrbacteria bacterium]|nr:DUF4931 domain-containing protein [Candidatus Uhrbacteria bacterium]
MRQSSVRRDYIQEKYVIIAPRRGKRPRDDAHAPGRLFVFCVIAKQRRESIIVVPNKYPAISLDNPKAYGMQDVVIEMHAHDPELEDLSLARIADLLQVYARRTAVISKNQKIEYILIFKNNGGRAGASLTHAHSQIFATNFIPPHLLDKSRRVQEYKLKHGTCVYCDVMKKERNGPRWVYEDRHVVAFCPYASMHNYEVWILPKRHLDNITLLSTTERRAWATLLKRLLTTITDTLHLPYNYYFHQVIHDEDQHLYMKITPRGSTWAGVEIGSGIIINPIAPESAARVYKSHSR